jgi:hypothetical protein
MFQLINKMEDIFRYAFFDRHLLASIKNKDERGVILKLELPRLNAVIEKKTESYLCSFLINGNKFLSTDIHANGFIYDENLNLNHTIPVQLNIGHIHSFSDFLIVFQGRIKNREYGIYSIPEQKILWMDNGQKSLESFGDLLFGQNKYELHRTNILTGKILWRHDLKFNFPALLDDRGGVVILGVYKSILIIGVEKIDKLLALDIETGSLKWEVNTFIKGLVVDDNKGLLHQMMVNYAAYDIQTGELRDNFKNNAYFESMGIESQRSNYILDGNHIITTDWRKGVVGAFNITINEFDWVHKEEGIGFPSPNPMIYEAPYLLVHDNKGSLHIFEKE